MILESLILLNVLFLCLVMMLCSGLLLANPLVTLFLFLSLSLSLYWHPSLFRVCVLQQALGGQTSQCKQHGQNLPFHTMTPCAPSFDFQGVLFHLLCCKRESTINIYLYHFPICLHFYALLFLFIILLTPLLYYNTQLPVSFFTCFSWNVFSFTFPSLLLPIPWTVSIMMSLSLLNFGLCQKYSLWWQLFV